MPAVTTGRKPTLGEVLDYYTREDFLALMLSVLDRHRVVTVISKTMHWEPDWERDEVTGESVAELRDLIVAQIAEALPGLGADERPITTPRSTNRCGGGPRRGSRAARTASSRPTCSRGAMRSATWARRSR